jgi:hypothetical protein
MQIHSYVHSFTRSFHRLQCVTCICDLRGGADDEHRVRMSQTEFWLVSPSENLVRVENASTPSRQAELEQLVMEQNQGALLHQHQQLQHQHMLQQVVRQPLFCNCMFHLPLLTASICGVCWWQAGAAQSVQTQAESSPNLSSESQPSSQGSTPSPTPLQLPATPPALTPPPAPLQSSAVNVQSAMAVTIPMPIAMGAALPPPHPSHAPTELTHPSPLLVASPQMYMRPMATSPVHYMGSPQPPYPPPMLFFAPGNCHHHTHHLQSNLLTFCLLCLVCRCRSRACDVHGHSPAAPDVADYHEQPANRCCRRTQRCRCRARCFPAATATTTAAAAAADPRLCFLVDHTTQFLSCVCVSSLLHYSPPTLICNVSPTGRLSFFALN